MKTALTILGIFYFITIQTQAENESDPFRDYEHTQESLEPEILIDHDYFIISYDPQLRQANWVSYQLKHSKPNWELERPGFSKDPNLNNSFLIGDEFRKSGYDRGHLVPAADMRHSETAYNSTFYMSNISPQAANFNRGIWLDLENILRQEVRKEFSMTIITGPLFKDKERIIGKSKVIVPTHFWKIVLSESEPKKVKAFLIPNRQADKTLDKYAISVDELEALLQIDFFANFDYDELEKLNSTDWEDHNYQLIFIRLAIGVILSLIIYFFIKKRRENYVYR